MSSRSDMSDLQDTTSSGSTFRDDRDDVEVVDQMSDTTNQMGEDMPIGLGGSFEYQGAIRRVRGGEAEGTDKSGEDSAQENQGGVTIAVARSSGEKREGG
ncbi:hypothetical protein GBA52_008408 [Prunus armeniaca]|nr:hypothetical protein GBA52_008408 [Prunus armeniaca]